MPVARRDSEGDAAGQRGSDGADILLGNTYHLMLRPTRRNGWRLWAVCNRFMNWSKADPDRLGRLSGHVAGRAAQADRGRRAVFLAHRRVEAHADAGTQHGDPEAAGVGIVMCFDECPALLRPRTRWQSRAPVDALGAAVARCLRRPAGSCPVRDHAGRRHARSARESAEALKAIGFDCYAVALAVGEGAGGDVFPSSTMPGFPTRGQATLLMGVSASPTTSWGRSNAAST